MRGFALPVEHLPNPDSQGFIEATPPAKGPPPLARVSVSPLFQIAGGRLLSPGGTIQIPVIYKIISGYRLPGHRFQKMAYNLKGLLDKNQKDVTLKSCNENIEKAIALSEAMLELAESGDMDREDVGCGILYGILRDAAYRIKKIAEAERSAHMQKGTWE